MSGLEGLLTGRTLVKRYRIEAVIGRGGFAAVYRADDERLDRPVAVKVITLAAPDEETRESLRERFQREARSAASLPQHPNVVTVHDFGTDPELGLDFLVMEFLHGEDLATHLARQRKLPLESALRVLRDAVEGVAVGHRCGLIHRDVKPGNIFLAEPHGEDPFRVCVLDFGIAHVRSQDQTSTRLTKTGIPLSPAYCSPEQLGGERDLLPASDVFSLGVVAYQLLTGEKPLRADRTVDPVDWAPDRSIRDLNPSVPPTVAAVIERAMSYDPAERYQDADAMADALDEAVAVAPVGDPAVAAVPVAAVAVPVPPEDERTLLQPDPLPPSTPLAAPAPPAGAVEKRPAYATWGIVVLVAALATVAGLWALTRGGAPDARPDGEVILQDSGEPIAPEVQSSGTRVTGQIVETPRPSDADVFPPAPDAIRSAPPFPDPASTRPEADQGTIIMPPVAQPPIARPPTEPPPDTRPSIPNRGTGIPAPEAPTALPPAPPAAAPAPSDTAGPPLLGTPSDAARESAPAPAAPSGGGGGAPSPDSAGVAPEAAPAGI